MNAKEFKDKIESLGLQLVTSEGWKPTDDSGYDKIQDSELSLNYSYVGKTVRASVYSIDINRFEVSFRPGAANGEDKLRAFVEEALIIVAEHKAMKKLIAVTRAELCNRLVERYPLDDSQKFYTLIGVYPNHRCIVAVQQEYQQYPVKGYTGKVQIKLRSLPNCHDYPETSWPVDPENCTASVDTFIAAFNQIVDAVSERERKEAEAKASVPKLPRLDGFEIAPVDSPGMVRVEFHSLLTPEQAAKLHAFITNNLL
jgi:hypothetical protein